MGGAEAPPARVREEPPPVAPEPGRAVTAHPEELERLVGEWRGIIDRVGRVAVLAKGLLVDARPVFVGDDTVVVAFDAEFAGERDELQASARAVKGLERAIVQQLGRPVCVDLVVSDRPLNLGGGGTERAAPGKQKKSAGMRGRWADDPTVRKTIEMFGGEIVDIRE